MPQSFPKLKPQLVCSSFIPFIILVTFSVLFLKSTLSFLRCKHENCLQYSSCGCSKALYSCKIVFSLLSSIPDDIQCFRVRWEGSLSCLQTYNRKLENSSVSLIYSFYNIFVCVFHDLEARRAQCLLAVSVCCHFTGIYPAYKFLRSF